MPLNTATAALLTVLAFAPLAQAADLVANQAAAAAAKRPAITLKIAEDGYAAGGSTGSLFTVLLARVKMLQGDKEKAIELQTKAIASLPDTLPEASRQRYQTTLEAYKAGKLPASPSAR